MAAADYRLCDICTRKTFYDAEVNYEPSTPEHPNWPNMVPDRVGSWRVLCVECAKTHEIVIRPKTPQRKGD